MAILHSLTALNSSTATTLNVDAVNTDPVTGEKYYAYGRANIAIQNVDSAATVYLGSSTVTSSSYGYAIPPLGSISIDNLDPSSVLYAISTGSSNVAVLTVAQ